VTRCVWLSFACLQAPQSPGSAPSFSHAASGGRSGMRRRICLCAGPGPSRASGRPLSQLRPTPVAAAPGTPPPPKTAGRFRRPGRPAPGTGRVRPRNGDVREGFPGPPQVPAVGIPLYDAGVRALSGERGRQGTVIGSLVWLCTATISRLGSGTQHLTGGCRPCDASLRRRPLRRRRNRRAAITAMRRMAVGVKNHGQPPEERDHCDDWDDDGSQARSCHVIPSLRSEPAGRDCGSRSPGRPAFVLAKGPGPAPVSGPAR
jgi:hypothetical protein